MIGFMIGLMIGLMIGFMIGLMIGFMIYSRTKLKVEPNVSKATINLFPVIKVLFRK